MMILEQMYKRNIPKYGLQNLYDRLDEDKQKEMLNLVDSLFRGIQSGGVAEFLSQDPSLEPHLDVCRSNMYKTMKTTERIWSRLIQAEQQAKHRAAEETHQALLRALGMDRSDPQGSREEEDLNAEFEAQAILFGMDLDEALEEGAKVDAIIAGFSSAPERAGEILGEDAVRFFSQQSVVDILHYYGLFKDFFQKKGKKKREGQEDIDDVVFGNDLPMVLSDEFMDLADDDLALMFYKRFAEEQLTQLNTMTQEEERGKVHIMVDYSGSMYNLKPVAAGFTLAAYEYLYEQDDAGVVARYTESATIINRDPEPLLVLKALSQDVSGGTDLSKCLRQIATDLKGGDIFVVTDGKDTFEANEEIRKLKADGARFRVLFLGNKPSAEAVALFDTFIGVDMRKEALEDHLYKLAEFMP